jgi:hypothetical protein
MHLIDLFLVSLNLKWPQTENKFENWVSTAPLLETELFSLYPDARYTARQAWNTRFMPNILSLMLFRHDKTKWS